MKNSFLISFGLIVFLFLSGCNSNTSNLDINSEETVQEGYSSSTESQVVLDETFATPSVPSSRQIAPLTYKGEICSEDCSGHEAGYEWAENNAITEEVDCDGNSESFNDGCRSYINENSSNGDSEENSNETDSLE